MEKKKRDCIGKIVEEIIHPKNIDCYITKYDDLLYSNLLYAVEDIDFSVRACRMFRQLGIKYINSLVQKEESELLTIHNFGRKTLREIKQKLAQMGLCLGMKFNYTHLEKKIEQEKKIEHDKKKIEQATLDQRIENIIGINLLSVRTLGCLKKLKIVYVRDLVAIAKKESALRKMKNVGTKTIYGIRDVLDQAGFVFIYKNIEFDSNKDCINKHKISLVRISLLHILKCRLKQHAISCSFSSIKSKKARKGGTLSKYSKELREMYTDPNSTLVTIARRYNISVQRASQLFAVMYGFPYKHMRTKKKEAEMFKMLCQKGINEQKFLFDLDRLSKDYYWKTTHVTKKYSFTPSMVLYIVKSFYGVSYFQVRAKFKKDFWKFNRRSGTYRYSHKHWGMRINLLRLKPCNQCKKLTSNQTYCSKKCRDVETFGRSYNHRASKWFERFDRLLDSKGVYGTSKRKEHRVGRFYLDYINHEYKIIIEWDEEYHYRNNHDCLEKNDVERQDFIQKQLPDYTFMRIREKQFTGKIIRNLVNNLLLSLSLV